MFRENNTPNHEKPGSTFDDLLNTAVDRVLAGRTMTEKQRNETADYFKTPLREYLGVELTLPIEDKPMRRICQVLTEAGFITVESCDGHGEKLPKIFFECQDQMSLRRLAFTIQSHTSYKSLRWYIRLFSGNPSLNPDSPLMFILEAEQGLSPTEVPTKRNEALQDLDLLGLGIYIEFFENEEESEE